MIDIKNMTEKDLVRETTLLLINEKQDEAGDLMREWHSYHD